MKTIVAILVLTAASAAQAGHFCEKAVIRQAKQRLSSQLHVQSVVVKSHENKGEVTSFTVTVASSTRSGNTNVREDYEANVDASCAIQGDLTAVPDSQVVDER